MPVYYDLCTQPGSPNDDAGYTRLALPSTSPDRIHALGGACARRGHHKAAVGISQCWDVLLKISERIGRDWEPVDTCVSDIADYCASSIYDPRAIESLDADLVAEYFSDPENWKSCAPQVDVIRD